MSATTPTSQKVRWIAPDLARGLALLGIALANVPTAWSVARNSDYAQFFGGVTAPGTLTEDIAVVLHAMFMHVRGLAMFTTLLGFGVGLITVSLWRRGFPPDKARRVLWRRYGLLALFGVAHLVLLFFGDILLQYSITALVLIAMITLRDRTLMIIAGVMLSLGALTGVISLFSTAQMADALPADMVSPLIPTADTYGGYVAHNAGALLWVLGGTFFTMLMMLPLMIVGFVWARRGVLTDVASHRRELIGWVILGAAVVLLIGLPWGLATIGVLPESWAFPLQAANTWFGLLTGPGIIAFVALLFPGTEEESSPLLRPFIALGRRSLSGYVLQSFVLMVLTQPFGLGLAAGVGILPKMGVAALAWAVTLAWAYAWDLLDWPGPLEWAHRSMVYGRRGLPETYPREAVPVSQPA